ncbi:MAG: NAD-dependent succinate-semialdehyde dehydrogenase [Flaviflexus sp.]|nr:NAD-dependent succinate-semialdehyde dehydrogenase [Flaviflexus sp.]
MNQDRVAKLLAEIPTQLYIDGEFRDSSSGATFDVLNPATGEVIAQVADATPEDGMAALDAAVAAQRAWAATPSRERSNILRRAFDLVQDYREDLAAVMTLEMGKPLDQADGEVTYGGEFLRWFSEEAPRIRGDYFRVPEGHISAMVVRRPVGPCLFITPWNFPLAMATRKVGPAMAAGCTSILRPSKDTPLTALFFAKIMHEAGAPAGVVNVIPGSRNSPVTGPMIQDPRLRKLSFTGSTQVGRALLKESADNILRTSMELGGNGPFIVFEDADLDHAVTCAIATKMRNMGEACNAADHFFVHESVIDDFAQRLADALGSQKVGNGLDDGVQVGPLINAGQRETIANMVSQAVEAGATVLAGGKMPQGDGFFYPPTVLTNVKRDDDIMMEEIFGPVAPICSFGDEEELIEFINSDPMGLASYVHTGSTDRILRLAERLEIGMIGVNGATISNAAAPFGGLKQSGLGREGGKEGIEEYLETIYVGLPAPDIS